MMQKKSLWYFVKQFKKNSVFVRNLLLFFIVLMIPMIICSYYFSEQTTNLLREQNAEANVLALERIADGLNSQLAETEYMSSHIGFRDEVQRFWFADKSEAGKYEAQIVEHLKSYVSTKNYIDRMFVYSIKSDTLIDNHSIYSFEDYDDKSWIEHLDGLKINDTAFIGRKKDGMFLNYITVIKPIYISPEYMSGVVGINISIKEISKKFGDVSGVNDIYIVQENENTIYCKDSKMINKPAPAEIFDIINDNGETVMAGECYNVFSEEQYVSIVPVGNYDMNILSLTPQSYYSQKVQTVRNNMIFILCF